MIIDRFIRIGVLRMTYYINHRNWDNLLGRQLEVKKVTRVNEKGHIPHPLGLHHQARPVSVTLHLLRNFIILNLQSFLGTYDVGVICFWPHKTAEQHKPAIRNYGSCWTLTVIAIERAAPAWASATYIITLGLSRERGRAEKTDREDDNWDDFPMNHKMYAPCVEDLNPSRNFHVDFLKDLPGPHIWQLLTNSRSRWNWRIRPPRVHESRKTTPART